MRERGMIITVQLDGAWPRCDTLGTKSNASIPFFFASA